MRANDEEKKKLEKRNIDNKEIWDDYLKESG